MGTATCKINSFKVDPVRGGTIYCENLLQGAFSTMVMSVSLRQASLLSLHSESYVTPSPPQTGLYSSEQLGHSQNAKSPLSTHMEW